MLGASHGMAEHVGAAWQAGAEPLPERVTLQLGPQRQLAPCMPTTCPAWLSRRLNHSPGCPHRAFLGARRAQLLRLPNAAPCPARACSLWRLLRVMHGVAEAMELNHEQELEHHHSLVHGLQQARGPL